MRLIVFMLICNASLFISCKTDILDEVQQRNQLNAFASRKSFVSLPPEVQKQLWIKKLETYFELELSLDQKNILRRIVTDLKSMKSGQFLLTENLRKNAIAMAEITPQVDFLNLFCEGVTVALPVLQKTGDPCTICIYDLENAVLQKSNADSNLTFRYLAPDCDCKWSCQQQEDNMLCPGGQWAVTVSTCQNGQTDDCCNRTPSGCGFFGIFSCTRLVMCDEF